MALKDTRRKNVAPIEYLLVGGYAVVYHGYTRSTGDMDIWIANNRENVAKLLPMIEEFGFPVKPGSEEILVTKNVIFRMRIPPLCIEIITSCSGIEFNKSYANRLLVKFDDVDVSLIDLADLRANKTASGRLKDLNDLENLPK